MSIKLLKKIANESIRNAGARYTPSIDSNAPNLDIKFLIDSIEWLVRSKSFFDLFGKFHKDMTKNFLLDEKKLNKFLKSKKYNIPTIINSIESYLSLKPCEIFDNLQLLKKSVDQVYKKLENKRSNLWLAKDKAKGERANQINSELYLLNKWITTISDLNEITNSKYFELSNKPYLLIGGEAGTGKTHFLCDWTLKKINTNKPILMVLAQGLKSITDPLEQIAKCTEFAKNKQKLLEKLAGLANKKNERALIIIDGINEGDYKGWKKCFSSLLADLEKYPQIGLIISARAPYDQAFCDEEYRNKILMIRHYGFDGIEFDATTQFFRYYNISTPDYPLLDSEFSNPLFLKIACEALKGIGEPKRKRRLTEIASGSKTITTLFEDYVNHCSESIEKKYKLPNKVCWNMIKGKEIKSIKSDVGLAIIMAKEGREWVYPEELKDVIQKHTCLTGNTLDEFYDEFLALSVIVSDIRWIENKKKIFRLPYQRISDHIIARSLLRNHLTDVNSESELREQLQENTSLGRVFRIDNPSWAQYDKPELATAIILEFPEYVKKKNFINDTNREVIQFLPDKNKSLGAFYQPFLAGLCWRSNSNFSRCTSYYVQFFLECDHPYARKKALESVSNLATRKEHIYNGGRLYKYLSKYSLPDRDLFWTEFIRTQEGFSVRGRLIRWLTLNDISKLDSNSVDNFIYILKLFLLSTDEILRDKSTKLIYDLGILFPKILFEHTLASFEFNDPYLFERMLAASYGVAMQCYATQSYQSETISFSKEIYQLMFSESAMYTTTHFITRNYASKLIELTYHIDSTVFTNTQIKRASPPFPKMGITRWLKSEPQDGAFPLGYEFRKSEIATLANNHDRYNFQDSKQIEIERKMLWRIRKLGYEGDKFKSIDTQIMQSQSFNQSQKRVQSYAEKYAFIAYYELLGFLYDRGVSLDRFCGSSDRIEVSIDPSFPIYKSRPDFVSRKLLRKSKNLGKWVKNGGIPNLQKYCIQNHIEGITGKAILLNGNIFHEDKSIKKRFSINFRSFLIRKDLKDNCVKILDKFHLDRLRIPQAPVYRYMYAGEVPWCGSFYLQDNENFTVTKNSIVTRSDGSKLYSYSTVLNVPVEFPDSEYSWSTQSCLENKVGSAPILSKNIIDHFGLQFNPDGMNFYDKTGQQVSSLIKYVETDYFHNNHAFLYISENILEKYMQDKNLALVWIISGDRAISFDDVNDIHKSGEECIWKRFKIIRTY